MCTRESESSFVSRRMLQTEYCNIFILCKLASNSRRDFERVETSFVCSKDVSIQVHLLRICFINCVRNTVHKVGAFAQVVLEYQKSMTFLFFLLEDPKTKAMTILRFVFFQFSHMYTYSDRVLCMSDVSTYIDTTSIESIKSLLLTLKIVHLQHLGIPRTKTFFYFYIVFSLLFFINCQERTRSCNISLYSEEKSLGLDLSTLGSIILYRARMQRLQLRIYL